MENLFPCRPANFYPAKEERTMNIVDLHVHSNKSDGSLTPTELVQLAAEKGLSAFALTDHDTTDGIAEALAAAGEYNRKLADGTLPPLSSGICPRPLEVIPGIEFSTEYEGKDIHIVGLYIDWEAPFFKKQIQDFVDSRITRNQKMCANLKEAGIDISYEKLLSAFPGSVITRGHYARYLLEHDYVKSMPEAFDRYLGDHTKYFVPREKVTPSQAVKLILKAKGLPILAHPPLYHMSDARLDQLVSRLKDAGLVGIEAIYSTYNTAEERQMRALASKYGLCISGGSDFHGANKPKLELATGYGKLFIPEDILTGLKEKLPRRKKIFFTDLDGTLLNHEKKITPDTRSALEKWTAAGHHFAICTGRALDSAMEVQRTLQLDFPGMYLIGSNGGEIYDCDSGRIVSRTALTMEQTALVTKTAREQGIHCHTYTDTHIVSPADDEQLQYYRRVIHTPVLICEDVVSALDKGPCKCIAIELHDRDKLEHFRKTLLPLVDGELNLLYSNDRYLEIFPAASGKGSAVRTLCSFLHIPLTDALAAGDEANDISMIQAAGTGIAMRNAKEEVRDAADIVTAADNDHDGLAAVLLANL